MFQATRMIRLTALTRTTATAPSSRVVTASLSTTSSIRNLESTPSSSASGDSTTPPPPSTPFEASSSSSNTTELSPPKPKSKPTWTRSSSNTASSSSPLPPSILPSYPALDALSAFRPIPVLPSSTHCATLTLRAYTPSLHHLTFFTQFALRSARALGLRTSGPHPLPLETQLITVPRSPFAHKKSQQNFWRKTHARRVEVYDANEELMDLWLGYLRKESMGGVGVKVQRFGRRELGWASQGERQSGVQGAEKSKGGMEEEVERLAKELEGEIKLGLKPAQEREQEKEQEKEVKEGTEPKAEKEKEE